MTGPTPDALLARIEKWLDRDLPEYVDPDDLRALIALARPSPQASDARAMPSVLTMPNGDTLIREHDGSRYWTVRDIQGRVATNETDDELAERYGLDAMFRAAMSARSPVGWEDIATAPKDGTELLVLCAESRRPFIAKWSPDGDAWVDRMGRFGGEAHHLADTGSWSSDGGWFQPDEVTHWQPLPEPPSADLLQKFAAMQPAQGGE